MWYTPRSVLLHRHRRILCFCTSRDDDSRGRPRWCNGEKHAAASVPDAPATHCCICARMRRDRPPVIREDDQRPSALSVYFCQRARRLPYYGAAAVINSPGNRNFRKLCGWVEINCCDCRCAAMRVPRWVPRFARSICSHRISEHTNR